jgi:hypothetical protein
MYVSSPKYHAHPIGLPVDASVNVTASGAAPDVGIPLNCATGTAAVDGLIHTKINTTTASNNTFVDFIFFNLPDSFPIDYFFIKIIRCLILDPNNDKFWHLILIFP